ncbi:MAG: sugar ABC transporter permease, partial [Acidobacteria bacterium]|nr:sugar ABC transporter permease [Acidobacteriota bacterium]
FYRTMVFLPLVLSVVVTGLLWLLIFYPAGGPVEPIWKSLFGHTSSFFGSYNMALPLVVFVQIWQNVGFTMAIYLAGLQNIPTELYEAVALDGAGKWQRFRYVTFPLIAPSTTVTVMLTAMSALGSYDLIYVITNGEFGTMTLGMYMFHTAFEGSSELGYASMVQMLQFAMTLVISFILLTFLRRREVQL